MLRTFAALALVALAAAGGSSLALALDASTPDACEPRRVPGLGEACLVGPSLFRITLPDGTVLHAHGPDPAPAADDAGFDQDAPQEAPVCADAPHLHVLYGFPSGSGDRTAEVVEEIRAAVRRMNALMRAEADETGGVTADFRVKCDADGAITVGSFQGPGTGNAYTVDYENVVAAARAAGFKSPKTNHLVFYDGATPGFCGAANNAIDDRLTSDNANLKGPNYAVVFGDACWSGTTPMHEVGHNMGAVQRLAPFSDLNGHCLEGRDVMCYTSDLVPLCTDRVHFDCGHDTYFHAAPPAGSWLATHWNVGSRLNVYLQFSDAPPADEAQPKPEPAQADRNETQATNATSDVPVAPSQEPAPANGTIAPQAVADAEGPAPVEPADLPGPLAAATAVALVAAAAARRRRLR